MNEAQAMRVVMLSTWDSTGGAAKAAFRSHEALVSAGVDSRMLVQTKSSALASVQAAPAISTAELAGWEMLQEQLINQNRSAVSKTYFSIGYPGVDLSEHAWVREADVIHLHWVAKFQSAVSLARLVRLGKPVVWSFHDQRAFTGGCHYSAGCRKYETDCTNCPQLREDRYGWPAAQLADQAALWASERITVVAPSQWMAECARRSRLFCRSRVEVIPYSLATEVFVPADRVAVRQKLGWPPAGCHLLFGAARVGERRKGFEELRGALRYCLADTGFRARVAAGDIHLACFGEGDVAVDTDLPVRSLGYVGTDAAMAQIYAASDLFILPTLEDNLPNTVLEAMSCGTPVVAFATGGVPDLVTDGVQGRLVPTGEVQQLGRAILDLWRSPATLVAMGHQCRQRVINTYTARHQSAALLGLYRELAPGAPLVRPGPAGEVGPAAAQVLARLTVENVVGAVARERALERLRQSRWVRLGKRMRMLKHE